MSTLIVEATPVLEKKPHPNADCLEFILLKGWWVIVQKNLVNVGDRVVYLPPESVITPEYAEKLGITKYCSPVKATGRMGGEPGTPEEYKPPGFRVRAARLRGLPSYGTIDHEVDPAWVDGMDLKEILNVRKWEPPRVSLDGDAAPPVSAFHQYTSIENLRNFPDTFKDGEEVVITEKLHGKNCRVGVIVFPGEDGEAVPTLMAGSHEVRRKEVDAKGRPSDFWIPLQSYNLKELIANLSTDGGSAGSISEVKNVVVFGELINTQKGFLYGNKPGEIGFQVFDISVNMEYLDHDAVERLCKTHDVKMVPILYRGPFSWAKVEEVVDGPTTLCEPDFAGSFKGREGVVIKPVKERFSPDLPGSGRVIGKAISVDYIDHKNSKGAEEVDASDA